MLQLLEDSLVLDSSSSYQQGCCVPWNLGASVYPIYFDVSLLKKQTNKQTPKPKKTSSHNLISIKICLLHLQFFSDFSLPWMLKALTSWDSHVPEAAGSISGGTTLIHAQPLDFSPLHHLLVESVELSSTQRIRTPCCQLHFQAFYSVALHTQHFIHTWCPSRAALEICHLMQLVWTWIETRCHRIT